MHQQGPAGSCVKCDAGTFKTTSGPGACTPCATNSNSLSGSNVCDCNIGYGSAGGTCTRCESGKFKGASGNAACQDCGAGSYSLKWFNTECMNCSAITCPAGQELRTCGGASGGLCQGCGACSSGMFQADTDDLDASATPCGCMPCAKPTCTVGQYASACTPDRDSRCQVCSMCGVGQEQVAVCTRQSNTECANCADSAKATHSVFTSSGSCAWRCNAGFSRDSSATNISQCLQDAPLNNLPPPLPDDEPTPTISMELQLSVSKQQFLAQQDRFIQSLARTAGVNPEDVKVMSITEVIVGNTAGARRQSNALKVIFVDNALQHTATHCIALQHTATEITCHRE